MSKSAITSVKITSEAYSLIGLHAAKYSQSTVLGYIIGQDDHSQATVTDIFPITHHAPAGAILEQAGSIAERLYPAPKRVLGVYYASLDNTAPVFIAKIAQELRRITQADCVVVKLNQDLIDSTTATATTATLFLEASNSSTGNKLKLDCVDSAAKANEAFNSMLAQHQHHVLADFEDHMNNGGKDDFTNTAIVSALRAH